MAKVLGRVRVSLGEEEGPGGRGGDQWACQNMPQCHRELHGCRLRPPALYRSLPQHAGAILPL